MTTNQSNLAKQLISAVAHTANYLKHSVERLRSLEGNLVGVEDQLSDIQSTLDSINAAAQSFVYNSPEYWQHQRVEIFKVALANTMQSNTKPQAILLAETYADDTITMLRAQEKTLNGSYFQAAVETPEQDWVSPAVDIFKLSNTYDDLLSQVVDPDCFITYNEVLSLGG